MLEWVHVRVGGGHLQLTGNLFLPFSWNKGCDWLHCVRTDLLHVGNKALKRLIHQQSHNNSRMSLKEKDMRSPSFIMARILSHANMLC